VHDWETDPRPYDQVLRAWRERHGWTWQQVADELREPLTTTQAHAKGRYTPPDAALRKRLMALIDQACASSSRFPASRQEAPVDRVERDAEVPDQMREVLAPPQDHIERRREG